ncbi:hypothetical protein V9T40_009175 [Parthenolecanium corni]|uniref:FAS1 domain-containing protein n=1 Tax=Parthenolecanium corni TaxID=536013 RepID=A0AAN9TM74_9HEMI
MTLFVPTNEAFQRLNLTIDKDQSLLNYHMGLGPYRIDELPYTLSPFLAYGGTQLRVTRTDKGVFVNNARIIPNQSQFFGRSDDKQRKVVHLIDEVLVPLKSKSEDPAKENPSAWGFLESSTDYKIGSFQIRTFATAVSNRLKQDVFRSPGQNTYLIPIDDGLRKVKTDLIDEKIIDAHIIPGKALFLNPTPESKSFETTAFTEFLKITVSFPVDHTPFSRKRFAKSVTYPSDQKYPAGVVLSEIVMGNIPVQNGVVHLIRQPLAVIDKNVMQYIDDSANSPLSTFKEKLRFASQIFRDKLNSPQGVTLFVPSNAAWKDSNVERAIGSNNTNLLENILNLHMVPNERLSVKQIRDRNLKEINTMYKQKSIYFNIIVQGLNQTLTVEAGGVNATAVYADIGATNGVIHVIDRVLGIPFTTVGRKVATDPVLNFTYSLGKFQNFNERLDDISQNFTYFVPRDIAWRELNMKYPDLYNALMTRPEFAYTVLEKHLVISGNYTMADLKKIANETYSLPAARGVLNIVVKENSRGTYYIKWNDQDVSVSRADVRCTNGIIHVIDTVLISPKDTPAPVGSARMNSVGIATLLMAALPLGALVFYH